MVIAFPTIMFLEDPKSLKIKNQPLTTLYIILTYPKQYSILFSKSSHLVSGASQLALAFFKCTFCSDTWQILDYSSVYQAWGAQICSTLQLACTLVPLQSQPAKPHGRFFCLSLTLYYLFVYLFFFFALICLYIKNEYISSKNQ